MDKEIEIWIRKIKKGDKKAFENLFLKFYDPLCKFAWRYLKSSHISEEIVQDVFLSVWESRESLNSGKNIKSYLYQAVRNEALNHIKHQDVANKYNKQIEWLNSASIYQIHKFEEASEFILAARKAINELPDGAQKIYKLNRKDGLTYKEIAQVLDISPRTVESQMSRTLKKLRESLSEYLPSYSSIHFKNED